MYRYMYVLFDEKVFLNKHTTTKELQIIHTEFALETQLL